MHGVRETFDYTFTGNITDTFDEVALTNADQTSVYLLVLHCTTSCYSNDQTQINDVMSSFTIRSSVMSKAQRRRGRPRIRRLATAARRRRPRTRTG